MVVTGRFVLLLALGTIPTIAAGRAGAAWASAGLWLAACLGMAAADAALAATPRRVALRRDLPARARLGEPVAGVVVVGNLGRRRMRALLRDRWQPTAGVEPARRRVALAAGESVGVPFLLRPRRRGLVRSAGVTLRTMGPLGIAGRQASLTAPGLLKVLPPFRSRRHLPSRLRMLRQEGGRQALQVRGAGTEFDSLRQYVRGDDVRSIDWRATARRGPAGPGTGRAGATAAHEPMVRTWRPERDRQVVIVVDSSRLAAARIGDETRLDTSVEAALLLAVLADRAGDRVGLVVFDRRVRARVSGIRGTALPAAIVDRVAGVWPELVEADWAALAAEAQSLTRGRCLVVLLTTLDAPASARGLLTALPGLTARHTVVVAGALDPAIREATTRRRDRAEIYRAAAAERAVLDSARVAAAARRLGATVVAAPADDLPAAVADRYIALKVRGLI
ncbi:MAG TPA: DUF58 domain-containing protein [Microbacteriaceae bacterium]|nr:DUF58 domain-containing protein [Microbacteriaceae bacterium]